MENEIKIGGAHGIGLNGVDLEAIALGTLALLNHVAKQAHAAPQQVHVRECGYCDGHGYREDGGRCFYCGGKGRVASERGEA